MSAFVEIGIGDLPETWPLRRLGDVFETQLGKMLSQKAHRGNAPKPYLRNKNVQWGSIDTSDMLQMDFSEPEQAKYQLCPGDLLVCEGGVPGRAAIWDGRIKECYYQKALHRLRPRNGIMTNEFMVHWLRFSFDLHNLYGVAGASSTIAHLPEAQLKALPIPVPPAPEQRKIAGVLGVVQRAMEQQERLLALTAELKKALLHQLFTVGLRGEPQKQTDIGPVPESWEVVPLGSIAKVGNGSTPKRDNEGYWVGGSIPWLNSAKIHERFITVADQFVTGLAVKECHLPRVKPSSLLIAITGQGKTLGNSALVSFETCINQHLAYAQFTSPQVVPEFALWFMQTRYEHLRSISQAGGSTKGALTCGYLKTYPIPVPSLDEQREIAAVFAALDRKQKAHEGKHAALTALFRTLLHQLMTAQLRVHELDLNGLDFHGKTLDR